MSKFFPNGISWEYDAPKSLVRLFMKKGIKALKIREQDICKGISQYLTLRKIWFRRIHSIGLVTTKGISDYIGILTCGKIGVMLCIEVKTSKGKLTPEQIKFLEEVRSNGGIAFVARSIEDVERELEKAMFDLREYNKRQASTSIPKENMQS